MDEKSGMQAKSRINPTKPAVPGAPVRQEFEYPRHGTAVLFAALNVHDGDVAAWVTDSTTRSENFVEFLGDLVAQTPAGLDLHCIVDNLKTHSTDLVAEFLHEHPHVHLHFTPTHAWLNQVELFFSILERRSLRRGEFASVDELAHRVIAFIKDYNRRAAPFRWTYDGRPLKVA